MKTTFPINYVYVLRTTKTRHMQARNQGGARGAFAPPPPTGPKGPDFDTRYPSLGVQSVK